MSVRSLVVLAGCLLLASAGRAAAENVLVSESTAQRHGLTRAWHAQIELDRSVDHVAYITQYGGILYLQTNHAMVHALDAETGRLIWTSQIGRQRKMSLAPGVNEEYLGVINGSSLFVVDRKNGKLKFERALRGAPGAGPALSKKRIFVGMTNGLLESYLFDEPKELPWVYQASGRILQQPIITEGNMGWTTDRGYFYVADAEEAKVRFRIETQDEITTRPASWTPYLYACSLDGFVYAVNEVTGKTQWKFPTGHPLSKQPAAAEGLVFVVSDLGGMHCLDGKTGDELWYAQSITQFCSLGAGKLYALDRLNRLTTLDVKTGARLDVLPLAEIRFKLINQQTDRIYLVTDSGTVQCLHDSAQKTPLLHTPPPLEKKGAAKATKQEGLPAKSAAEGDDAVEADEEMPAAKPAAGGDEEEGMEADSGDDPFG